MAARLCGERARRRQRTGCSSEPWHTGSRSLSCGSWALSRTSSSAREKIAMYGTTDAVVPALAIEILPDRSHGARSRWHPLRYHVHGGQLSDRVRAKLRARCLQNVRSGHVPEKKELILTRVFAVIMPLGALAYRAVHQERLSDILMFAWSFYAAAAGLPAFAALYWKKATTAGILSGMVVGFTVCIGWKLAGQPFGLGATVPGATCLCCGAGHREPCHI